MPSVKYQCIECNISISTHHIIHHTMVCHKDKLQEKASKDAMYKCAQTKGYLCGWSVKSETNGVVNGKVCFGCKVFYGRKCLAIKHEEDCPKKEEHKAFVKSLMPENVLLEAALEGTDTNTGQTESLTAQMADQMKKLLEENERLKKERDAFEKKYNTLKKVSEEDEEEREARLEILRDCIINTTDKATRGDMVDFAEQHQRNTLFEERYDSWDWGAELCADDDTLYRANMKAFYSRKQSKNDAHQSVLGGGRPCDEWDSD